jgi:hypothetical protein
VQSAARHDPTPAQGPLIRPSLAQLLTPSPTPVQRQPLTGLTRPAGAIVQRQSDDEEEEEGQEEEEEEFGRTPTAYSYLGKNAIAKVKSTTQVSDKPQGPHFNSDVATNEFFAQAKEKKRDLTGLLGTRIIPHPGQAISQVSDAFDADVNRKGRGKGRQDTSYQRRRFSEDYQGLYDRAKTGDEGSIRRLVNLAPQQTLSWSGKKATKAELAGKGETKEKAKADFAKSKQLEAEWKGKGGFTLDESNYEDYLGKFETVDTSTLKSRGHYKGLQHAKRHRNFGRFLEGESLSEASESEGAWSSEEDEASSVGSKRKAGGKAKAVNAKRTKVELSSNEEASSESESESEDNKKKKKKLVKKVKGK